MDAALKKMIDRFEFPFVVSAAGMTVGNTHVMTKHLIAYLAARAHVSGEILIEIDDKILPGILFNVSGVTIGCLFLEESLIQTNFFMANLSHEIRTPLTGIFGGISILQDTDLTLGQQDCIQMLTNASQTLLELVGNISDYCRLENSKIVTENAQFKVTTIMESCIRIVSVKAKEKKIQVNFTCAKNVGACYIGDAKRIKQVVINLLSNAIKFSDSNKVVTTFVTHENDLLMFRVRDQGFGISADEKTLLFKSSLRHKQPYNIEGMGIGLFICKRLCNLMGGDIFLDTTEVGVGSEFVFFVKVVACVDDLPPVYNHQFTNQFALILDDNSVNRYNLSATVSKWGFLPVTYEKPEEMFLNIGRFDFKIAFIDICMPKTSGVEIAKRLTDMRVKFPLVALSSLTDKVLQEYDKDVFTHFLVKPIQDETLYRVVCQLLVEGFHDVERVKNPTIRTDLQILVAEDNHLNRVIIQYHLRQLGYVHCDIVVNGREVMQALQNKTYHVVILDIKMPVKNGMETRADIARVYGSSAPKMIAMSAFIETGFDYTGFDDVLTKPIEKDRLGDSILKLFEG